jgi:hypothetical protein
MLEHGERVDFYRPGVTTDPYSGQPGPDWDTATVALSVVAAVEPMAGSEPALVDRGPLRVAFRLYTAGLVAVQPSWRALVRGDMLEVIGEPAQWVHPMTGWPAGTVIEVGVTRG